MSSPHFRHNRSISFPPPFFMSLSSSDTITVRGLGFIVCLFVFYVSIYFEFPVH